MEVMQLIDKGHDEEHLNYIDMIAKLIEVKDAVIWKQKDMTKVKDFKHIEVISDWTYSTTYKGNIRYLSQHVEGIYNETSLKLAINEDATVT